MNYKEKIKELLEQISDEEILSFIYKIIKNFSKKLGENLSKKKEG